MRACVCACVYAHALSHEHSGALVYLTESDEDEKLFFLTLSLCNCEYACAHACLCLSVHTHSSVCYVHTLYTNVYVPQYVLVSWRPPAARHRNGVLLGYKVQYKRKGSRRGDVCSIITKPQENQYVLTGEEHGREE